MTDGNDAISTAFRLRPHAIVIDLGLPGLDGAETIEILRSYAVTRSTPIVVCTARPERLKDRHPSYEALVQKPCAPAALEKAVREVLGEDSDSGTG